LKNLLWYEAARVAASFAATWLLAASRGRQTFLVDAVPRHIEIDEYLARKICKDLDVPNP
jgi:hypothetical protein